MTTHQHLAPSLAHCKLLPIVKKSDLSFSGLAEAVNSFGLLSFPSVYQCEKS